MALMPSIMSLFGGKAPAAATATAPAAADPATQQVQLVAAGANPTVPSGTTPQSNGSVAAIPPAGTGDGSPLAGFADLWKADPNNTQVTPSLVPSFNLDHKGLMESASKVNFVSHIQPELVAKAMAGDAEAFLSVINQASQFGYASATATTGELVKQSLGKAQNVLQDSVLPSALRQQAISQALNESNPVFQSPAVAPMLGMLKTQLAAKYPTASPQEIAAHATQYLAGMSEMVVKASGGTVTPKGQQVGNRTGFSSPQETDWTNFFDA